MITLIPAIDTDLQRKCLCMVRKNVRFHDHYDAKHGFALAPGVISNEYHELSDRRSTISMLLLFAELWGRHGYFPQVAEDEVNASGTKIGMYWCTSSKL